ncbi:MAG: TolB family protein [Phycisphaerales bacterium]
MQRSRTTIARLVALSIVPVGLAAGCASTTNERSDADSQATIAPPPIDLVATPEPAAPSADAFWAIENTRPEAWRGVVAASNQQPAPSVNIYGELPGNLGEISARPADGQAENLHQISFALEGSDFDPVVSRDGSMLVYSSTQHSRTADIYRKPTDGRAITQLTMDPANDVMPAISPDGSRVAFASDRAGSWDLYVMNSEGGQAVQLTSDASHELHPTWSPDGKHIAFCRLGEVSGKWELWVVESNNPGVRTFLGYGLFPEWSPVDDKIAFQRSREQGDRFFSVWTVDFENSQAMNPTEIASSPVAAIVNPTWSPDGSFLAFATIPNPTHAYGEQPRYADIWITHLDGTGRANLTGGSFVNLSPTWSGTNEIFFVSNRSGRDNIWSVRPLQAIVASGRSANENFAGAREQPGPENNERGLAEVNPDR